ncbi:MAG TPA: phosphoribosylformylglycinamidine synthase subunit PurS [Polyangiales bacterium]
MKANVYVTLKEEVLDPQGEAVRRALDSLGFAGVKKVRVGKLIEIDLDGAAPRDAETKLRAMCEKLLSNPIVEDFEFEIERA